MKLAHLFVYGTLQPKLAPPCVAHAVRQLRKVGRATAPGTLYDLGPYPAAKFDSEQPTLIHGGVYRMPRSPASVAPILHDLDEYEALDGDAAGALFVRTRLQVRLRDGRQLLCWAYQFNRPCDGGCVIPSGRYRSRTK